MAEKNFNKIDFPLPISMETAVPLDYNSVFNSFESASAAAATAVPVGTFGSKYYIGQLITVVDPIRSVYKTYRVQPNKTLKEIAAEYTFGSGIAAETNSQGSTTVSVSSSILNKINTSTITIETSSPRWNDTYDRVNGSYAKWDDTSVKFAEISAIGPNTESALASMSGKWQSTYSNVLTYSADWNSTYNRVDANFNNWQSVYSSVNSESADWQSVYSTVNSASADWQSAHSTLEGTSGKWESSYATTKSLSEKTSDELWETAGNLIADRSYVDRKISDNVAFYRGSFPLWSTVPTLTSGYVEDYNGNRTPQNNDYIVVRDASETSRQASVDDTLIGEKSFEDVYDHYHTSIIVQKDEVITAQAVAALKSDEKTAIAVYRRGSWRFRYTSRWSAAGKNGWVGEYQLNDTVFTEEQMAAIDSGINASKVAKISSNEGKLNVMSAASANWNSAFYEAAATSASNRSTYTTVFSNSGEWEKVRGKIGEDYFNYYTMSAWSDLTYDDSDYSRVPSGMCLIYEDDGTPAPVPVTNLSLYTKEDGLLRLCKNITFDYDIGYLYIGGDASYSESTETLTIPGSSDIVLKSTFNRTKGILSLSEHMGWDAGNGMLTLTDLESYNLTSGQLTIHGDSYEEELPSRYTIVKNSQHATITTNAGEWISRGAQLTVVINVESGYRLYRMSCTMGGVEVEPAGDTSYIIGSVTGDIVITAMAADYTDIHFVTNTLVGCTTDNDTRYLSHLDPYVAKITPYPNYVFSSKLCLMDGVAQVWSGTNYDTINIPNATADISIYATAIPDPTLSSVYYTSDKTLRFGAGVFYDDDTETLLFAANASYSDSSKVLTINGVVRDTPSTTYSVTNTLNNVINSNVSTSVSAGANYVAKLSTYGSGYEFVGISCTMNGIPQSIGPSGDISIPSVNGDIAITASASKVHRAVYDEDSGILTLSQDTAFPNGVINLVDTVRFDSTSGIMSMRGGLSDEKYHTVYRKLSLTTLSGDVDEVRDGRPLSMTLVPSSGYEVDTALCFMGGNSVNVVDNRIYISNVNAPVLVVAKSVPRSAATFSQSTCVLEMSYDTTYSAAKVLTLGRMASYSPASVITLRGSSVA